MDTHIFMKMIKCIYFCCKWYFEFMERHYTKQFLFKVQKVLNRCHHSFYAKLNFSLSFFNTILGLMTDVNFLWWRQEETGNFFFSSITSRWIVSQKFLTFVSSNLLNFNTFCFNFKKSKPLSWVFKLWLKSF